MKFHEDIDENFEYPAWVLTTKMGEKDITNVWQDIGHIITESLQTKIKEAYEKFSAIQKQLNETLEENARLQATINSLKKKQCPKCPQLIECTKMLKKKLKEKDDTISVIGKLFLNQNPDSYAAASQMVNDVITSSIGDYTLFETSPTSEETDFTAKTATPSPKSPDRAENPEPPKKESPVVAKKARSNKRKFLSISSLRRSKPSNGDPVPSISDTKKPIDCPETSLLEAAENTTKVMETCDKVADSTPPPSSPASPEILSSTTLFGRSFEGETPKGVFRRSRRSLDMSLANHDGGTSPKAKRKTPDSARTDKERCEPMDLEIAKAIEPLPEVPVGPKEPEKQPKTVWNLKRSREQLTSNRLKQTVLSTMAMEKKVDISTSSQYKGGSAAAQDAKFVSKENYEETFFEPPVTSTHNDEDPVPQKAAALAESTNKPRTPRKIENSFDCLPSTSPKYKYQRDAIRKKSERMKLPGQECAKCLDFYAAKRAECGEAQARKLLNKCSRHRHKFPITVYTPPGLWNPVFDDTDDEVDAK